MRKILLALIPLVILACTEAEREPPLEPVATTETVVTDTQPLQPTAGTGVVTIEEFTTRAALDGMLEVRLAEIAKEKGGAQMVALATRIASDHQKAHGELQNIATAKGISLPTALSEESQELVDRVSELSGTGFDAGLARVFVDEHRKAIALFERASAANLDPELTAFAVRTLPLLREHLQGAEALLAATR